MITLYLLLNLNAYINNVLNCVKMIAQDPFMIRLTRIVFLSAREEHTLKRLINHARNVMTHVNSVLTGLIIAQNV